MRDRRRSGVVFLLLGVLWLGGAASAGAAENGADEAPALFRSVAGVADTLKEFPPFLRDTELNLHLRTFYLGARNPDRTDSEAWAGGGWLEYKSGWLLDTLQLGGTLYGSGPIYAPHDRDGTGLLKPGQDGFVVPGVAYGASGTPPSVITASGRRQPSSGSPAVAKAVAQGG